MRRATTAVHLVYTLSEGPCESLRGVYINGDSVSIERGGTSYSNAVAYQPVSSSEYSGKAEFWWYDGTHTTLPASLAAADSAYWDSEHIGLGLAFVHVKLTQPKYGQEPDGADHGDRFWTSLPQMEFVVDGLKITYPSQTTTGIHPQRRRAAVLV